ncbi:N-acetylgalactosamine-N,N'-diacetylbacillosaminyl-diphospho-undecaprenol 4-alpha-N-acetylgalactosaminyltransferase [Pontiella desulfatans]|uniref:N-acetylgalactosamine-N,N'-diacetylbacillosaminyl -diphospho-undecaprenol 4-alpha-N-acetylgalactosaminyltransferase n=1 Tax=Pontiella desulfatans TaxID=2750659 RepID=A0A6C2UCI8_PONDE|nr:glycosyltransferase family 1 protein [Pontiella desulfatans]VGO16946.1 N-acetylgalactosamine-N,N'-diacetylbacillosaminyl-diphospho-undecaprenol 4-alpha-N-acetylgalactosaminyltransferase [Pontiella desulfatans]
MRIGFSTFVLDGGQTGVATYICELLRFLQLEDTENTYDLLMAQRDADLVPLTNPNFSKTVVPSIIGQPLVNLVWHNTALAAAGRKLDVLHVPSARRVPLVKGTKVVATVHDLAAFAVEAKYDPARMLFNRKLVPAMIRNADHVITVSEFTKSDIVKHVGYPEERISVIYSGINRDLFQPVAAEEARDRLQVLHGLDKPFFVYVSRLEHPAKNHVRLIEAFERFKLQNDSSHQLVLAGADWNGADAIKARAAESPVKDDIVFLGFVPVKSLPLLYSGCDLMVFPSLFEGFGFPIVEALACGAPVACSNTSSMKEIAGDLLPTFDPTDPEALFRSMERTVAQGWSPEMRTRGTDYALTFDWRKTAERVLEVYRSLT